MENSAPTSIAFFTGFKVSDFLFLGEAALRTLLISVIAITSGSLFGILFGWLLAEFNRLFNLRLEPCFGHLSERSINHTTHSFV